MKMLYAMATALSLVFGLMTGSANACGYYGCQYNILSYQLGQAEQQLAQNPMAAQMYTGITSNINQAMSIQNQVFNQIIATGQVPQSIQQLYPITGAIAQVGLSGPSAFGVNPVVFNQALMQLDQGMNQALFMANPRNFYPQWAGQMTSMGRCIPGFTIGCGQ